MKNRFTLLLFAAFISITAFGQNTGYRTVASGSWDDVAIWERTTNVYAAAPTWAPIDVAASQTVPGTNHNVRIRTGHTVTAAAGKNCLNMIIESGATFVPGGTFRVGAAQSVLGGGFVDTLRVDGTLGAPGSQIGLELATSCKSLLITGTGLIQMGRFRPNNGNFNYPGSPSLNAGTGAVVLFDANAQFSQSGNYAFSVLNSAPVNDSTNLTILPGKTVTLTDPLGQFHNDLSASATANGKFVYNINGTLDLSAFTSTTGGSTLVPFQNASSSITLNVNGLLKLGAYFKAIDTVGSPALGSLFLNINNGGVIDATLTNKLISGSIGMAAATPNIFFKISGNGSLRRTVPADATKTEFNIGTSLNSYSPLTINGNGPAEVFTVTVSDVISHANPPAQSLDKEWSITEQTAGGNTTDTLRFSIPYTVPGPPAPGVFNPLDVIYVYRWNGSAWEGTLASKSGGTGPTDPFVARVTGFNAFGSFILSNTPSSTTPVVFVNVKAYQKQNGVLVEFGNATESDVAKYAIEKSADGASFTSVKALEPKTNNGGLNSYSYFDATPNRGNNFYRVKVTERNGNVKYSSVLSIRLLTDGIWVNAYPNPVKGGTVNVQLENFDKSVYSIAVFNQVGQKVYTKSITHNGGTATFAIDLPSSVNKGIYSLQVSNASTRVINKIVVE